LPLASMKSASAATWAMTPPRFPLLKANVYESTAARTALSSLAGVAWPKASASPARPTIAVTLMRCMLKSPLVGVMRSLGLIAPPRPRQRPALRLPRSFTRVARDTRRPMEFRRPDLPVPELGRSHEPARNDRLRGSLRTRIQIRHLVLRARLLSSRLDA